MILIPDPVPEVEKAPDPGSVPALLPSIHLEICQKKTHQARILEGVEEKHVPEAAVSESRAEYGNPVLGGPVAHARLVIYLHP